MYDDAYMPHMQRLTWSGIALHGGPLPGYAASHGCVRMPYDFAERLFDATWIGMRIILAPSEAAPVEIDHPILFQPKTSPKAVTGTSAAVEADDAASKANQARLAAVTASREATAATVSVRVSENLKLKADAQLAAAERAIASAGSAETREQADDTKAKAAARVDELEARLAAAKAELQPKLDALAASRGALAAAETERVAAAEAARKVARDLEPVSVFISRKNQRLYVRQAFQPILEIPITIQDADRPIGTHIFTAMERTGDHMRWSVVSLVGGQLDSNGNGPNSTARGGQGGDSEAASTDVSGAKAALDRIAIPGDTINHIAEIVSPRSSLIISDEALSSETSKGTEFVILLSGEPQGGIAHRRRVPQVAVRYDRPGYRVPYWRSPFAGSYSAW